MSGPYAPERLTIVRHVVGLRLTHPVQRDQKEKSGEVAYQKAFRRLVRDLQVKRG